MNELRPTGALPLLAPHRPDEITPAQTLGSETGVPFSQFLVDAVSSANAKHIEASQAAEAFAAGARDDIHGTMIAIKEAEIELKLVSNVRSKLVDAWNELWRMSV